MTDTATVPETAEIHRNEVIVTLDGRDVRIPMETLSLSLQSTDQEILNAVRSLVLEQERIDIMDTHAEFSYVVSRAENSNTLYILPKPGLGK